MTKTTLQIAMVIVTAIAVAALAYGVSMSNKATSLQRQLKAATQANDSLSKVIQKQDELLEAEGAQFQNDLLTIDSLQNRQE